MNKSIITVLAIRRLTQLVVQDELTSPVRDRIMEWAKDAPTGSPKERISYLVGCGACASVWASAVILLLNRHRTGRVLNTVLAGSGAVLIMDAFVKFMEES